MTKSVFASDLRVYGDVSSKGDLDVQGHVEGTVGVKDLIVGRAAAIEGQVRAASVAVAGAVVGGLECDRVSIESTGRVEGDVTYRTLSMLVGGCLNARCVPFQSEAAAAVQADSASSARRGRAERGREKASAASRQAVLPA
jgi:cytoskeletal protein CcmA (bactofilin family)